MFGEPKKRLKRESQRQIQIELLEKHVRQLELRLEESLKRYESVLEELKNTESQKTIETSNEENLLLSEENETILHGLEEDEFSEPDYIILPKPTPRRQKAIDILEKEAVKEVSTNRREIIKKKIEEELQKKEMSAKELKIYFVDELEYCSKATFYRYLESLRKEHRIDSIKINGKEYLCSIPSKENKSIF